MFINKIVLVKYFCHFTSSCLIFLSFKWNYLGGKNILQFNLLTTHRYGVI